MRKENLARAIEHESNGNGSAAYDCYQKAVDISPSIAHDLIQVVESFIIFVFPLFSHILIQLHVLGLKEGEDMLCGGSIRGRCTDDILSSQ